MPGKPDFAFAYGAIGARLIDAHLLASNILIYGPLKESECLQAVARVFQCIMPTTMPTVRP